MNKLISFLEEDRCVAWVSDHGGSERILRLGTGSCFVVLVEKWRRLDRPRFPSHFNLSVGQIFDRNMTTTTNLLFNINHHYLPLSSSPSSLSRWRCLLGSHPCAQVKSFQHPFHFGRLRSPSTNQPTSRILSVQSSPSSIAGEWCFWNLPSPSLTWTMIRVRIHESVSFV